MYHCIGVCVFMLKCEEELLGVKSGLNSAFDNRLIISLYVSCFPTLCNPYVIFFSSVGV